MRILNLLVIEKGLPRIVESFPVVDEQLSDVTIETAEDVFCTYVLGIMYKETTEDAEIFRALNHGYNVGVKKPSGAIFHLVWSSIPD